MKKISSELIVRITKIVLMIMVIFIFSVGAYLLKVSFDNLHTGSIIALVMMIILAIICFMSGGMMTILLIDADEFKKIIKKK